MAYFPNGTAGMAYEEEWCSRCVHQNGPDGESGCPVWGLHLIHNYDECNKPDSFLHILIPNDGLHAGKCRMFHENRKAYADGDLFEQQHT